MNANDPLNATVEPSSYEDTVLTLHDHEPLLRSPRLPFASIGAHRFPINLDARIDPSASSFDDLMLLDRQAALDWLLNLRAVDDYVYEEWANDLRDIPDQLALLTDLVDDAATRIREVKALIETVSRNGLKDPD